MIPKEIEKLAQDWELKLHEIFDKGELIGFDLSTFEDRSVGLYGIRLGEFTRSGFASNDKGLKTFLADEDAEFSNDFEAHIQLMEKSIQSYLESLPQPLVPEETFVELSMEISRIMDEIKSLRVQLNKAMGSDQSWKSLALDKINKSMEKAIEALTLVSEDMGIIEE